MGDFGHTSPNSRLLLSVGFSGLLERVESAGSRDGLSEKQMDFYDSARTVLRACMSAARRLAEAAMLSCPENAAALYNIANGAPSTVYEAMHLLLLYFFLHEYVGGTRVRTLGRVDVLLEPFYKRDLERGTYTREDVKEMLKFFLYRFWCAKVPFDLPFCLGGIDADGNEVTSEISYLIVEALLIIWFAEGISHM
jgi:formate C-acetyltransferase